MECPSSGAAVNGKISGGKMNYSPEIITLRDRIIRGNEKLAAAWDKIKNMEGQQWNEEMERWHQASSKLSTLCTQLKLLGYEDCLYLDNDGKKTKKCLEGTLGCLVCPSKFPYWEKELF
jgi:hypothetical protein